jgi:cytidyltransferase-like protein
VLGGTFDPIHLGHLRAAENAREALGLDQVLFIPSGSPPHRGAPLSSALDRFAMVALATAGARARRAELHRRHDGRAAAGGARGPALPDRGQ